MKPEIPTSLAMTPDGPRRLEAMDGAGWRQTIRDLPVTALSSALGYLAGGMAAEALLKRFGDNGQAAWLKHVPQAAGIANAVALPFIRGKLNAVLQRRRHERRLAEHAAKGEE